MNGKRSHRILLLPSASHPSSSPREDSPLMFMIILPLVHYIPRNYKVDETNPHHSRGRNVALDDTFDESTFFSRSSRSFAAWSIEPTCSQIDRKLTASWKLRLVNAQRGAFPRIYGIFSLTILHALFTTSFHSDYYFCSSNEISSPVVLVVRYRDWLKHRNRTGIRSIKPENTALHLARQICE